MSTNKAKISRTLVIDSPIHLWTILKNKYIYGIDISVFMYLVDKYINGCRCDDDINLSLMNNEYRSLYSDPKIVEVMKIEFQCSYIVFNNDIK